VLSGKTLTAAVHYWWSVKPEVTGQQGLRVTVCGLRQAADRNPWTL